MEQSTSVYIASISKERYGDSTYIDKIWIYLYQSSDYTSVISRIKGIPFPKGICARTFDKSSIGWFCKQCGKDANCVQCQECFEASDHVGHLVYLDQNISGCCDCGDAAAWNEAGFCKAHQGFIEESKASIDLLPENVAKVAPLLFETLTNRYFNLCCFLRFVANPSSKNEFTSENYALILKEISLLISCFMEISEKSPIFLYMMASCLAKERTRYRVEKEGLNYALVTLADPLSIIDITMKINDLLAEELAKESILLLINHLKSKAFKYALAKSFVVHYPRMIRNECDKNSKGLDNVSVQILSVEELTREVFSSPQLFRPLLLIIKKLLSEISPENIVLRSHIMNIISHDLKYMFRAGTMNVLLESSFLSEYIEVCSEYTAMIKLPVKQPQQQTGERIYVAALEIELALMQIFRRISSCIDYTDEAYCKKLAGVFKEILIKLKEKTEKIKESYYNIPIHRFLSYFLVSYSHTHFLLKRIVDGKEFGKSIKSILKDLFEIDDDSEYNKFVQRSVYPTLKVIGFYMEAFAHRWNTYGESLKHIVNKYSMYDYSFALYDFALCSLLFSSYDDKKSMINEFIASSMSQDGYWLNNLIIKLLLDDPISSIKESFKDKEFDFTNAVVLLDNFLFSLASLCSNDCLTLSMFFDSTKGKYFKHKYLSSLEETVSQLKSYAYKKWLVHSYFSLNDPWVQYKSIEENIPKEFRRDFAISKEFSAVFKTGIDSKTDIESYMIVQEYSDLFNLFFFPLKSHTKNADEKLRKLNRHIKDPQKFNPLFGIKIEKGNMFDLTERLSEVLAGSMLPNWLIKLLARANKGELNNSIIISILQLIKSFKKYVPKIILPTYKPEIENALRCLQMSMGEYNESLITFGEEFGIVVSPIKMIKEVSSDEYKGFGIESIGTKCDPTAKNSSFIPESAICVVCKESVMAENFLSKPYGKSLHLSQNNMYEHYLRQNGIESKNAEGLSFNSCEHNVHYKCFNKLPEAAKCNMLTYNDVIAGWRANLNRQCTLCKLSITTLCPPSESIKELNKERTVKNFLQKFIQTVLTVNNSKWKSSEIKEQAKTGNLIDNLCDWLTYSIKISSITKINSILTKKEVYLSILYAARWLAKYNKEKTTDLRKPQTKLKEAEYLECDSLKMLIKDLLWIKVEESNLEETVDSVMTRWFYIVLWQATIKCAIEKSSSFADSDIKEVTEFIKLNELEIKSLCYKWLESVMVVKCILFDLGKELLSNSFETLLKNLLLTGVYTSFINQSKEVMLQDPNEMLKQIQSMYFTNKYNSLPESIKALGINEPFKFINLEDKFTDCLKVHYKRKCKQCNEQVKDNGLCFLCGEILCFGGTCCQRNKMNEIVYHAQICTKGIGVFLHFHTNKIRLVDDIRCGIYPSPYVNSRGEDLDMSKRVFEVLNLNQTKLEKLKTKLLRGKIAFVIDSTQTS